MGDGQHLLPLTIGHSHGVWGHHTNNRRLDFFSAFPLFSTFPCSSGLHSRKRPLSTLVFVFWILNVQRETFVPSTPRSPETSMPEMKLGYSSMSPHCPRFQFGGGKILDVSLKSSHDTIKRMLNSMLVHLNS